MSTLAPSWKNFCHAHAYFTLLTSFDVWASQAAKLTMYETEKVNKTYYDDTTVLESFTFYYTTV